MATLKGFREKLGSYLLGHRKGAPVIMTESGPVTEAARFNAAMNMLADPEIRIRVEKALAKQYGSVERGLLEAKRRYPESYPKG